MAGNPLGEVKEFTAGLTPDSGPDRIAAARTATSGSPRERPTGSAGSRRPASSPSSRPASPPAAARRDHGRPGRQPLVHRANAATRSAGSRPTGAITEFTTGLTAGSYAARDHGRARTATSGSPSATRQPDRPDHHRRRDHRVHDRPDRRQRPAGHRRGPGRQPLVHRARAGNRIGRITTGRRDHRVLRPASPPAASPHGIAAGPGRQPLVHRADRPSQIGRITTGRRDHRVRDRAHRRQRAVGIAAGPDGNLWFTESANPGRIGRITPAGAINEFSSGLTPNSASAGSPPARTATSGSPRTPIRAGSAGSGSGCVPAPAPVEAQPRFTG